MFTTFPRNRKAKRFPMGYMTFGMTYDTAEFAVESIAKWWKTLGRCCYRRSQRLLICADSGGSNSSRARLWKVALQQLADEFSLASKWNKIEHKMFSFISINWKGEPLISYETVINLISTTTTQSGLKIVAELDRKSYGTGITRASA